MKTYLIINPQCFIWHNDNEGLIYNSEKQEVYRFSCNEIIKQACTLLDELDNLYSIELSAADLENSQFNEWVSYIESSDMGKVINVDSDISKPITMPPVLNVQKSIEKLKKQKDDMTGYNIIAYLHEVSIYMGGDTAGLNYYRQVESPADYSEEIPFDSIASLLIQIQSPYPKRINFIGDGILTRPDINDIIGLTTARENANMTFTLVLNGRAILSHKKQLERIYTGNPNIRIKAVCYADDDFQQIELLLKKIGPAFLLSIFITSPEDYATVEPKLADMGEYELCPVYNGENIDFLEENVFLDKEDLATPGLSKREVFANQAINTHFFGKLSITPTGEVYANINHPPLGTINDNIYSLVYKELLDGQSWLMRRDFKKCSKCLNRWLCPSPTNIEILTGRQACNIFVTNL